MISVKRLLFIFLSLIVWESSGQIGGQRSFEFLNVPTNARLAGLGGVNTSLADRDINFFFSNPALISDSLSGFGSASYQFYVGDIGHATFAYAHRFKTLGTVSFGVQHLSLGTIKGYDAAGMEIGEFKSGETALVLSKSHQVSAFRLGANLKAVFSNIAGYRGSALMLDLGGTFVHPKQDLTVGLVIRNLGFVLSEYSETSSTTLPFDVQLGATFKPEHMPIRFSLTAYNLLRSGIPYYNPADGEEEPSAFNKILRRFNLGMEILLHRNVNALIAYNYNTHQELKLANGGAGAGLCFGFSARIKAVEFVFSRGGYVAGQGGYTFTLSSNIDKMIRRR